MLNALWAFMMLTGLGWAAVHGTLGAVTEGMLAAAGDAVSLGITMLGVMAFWTGILEIGRRAGLIEQLSAGMRPVLHFLFPRIPAGHPALSSMAANMIANMLGLGWAATPAGLTAMKELEELEEERRAAGDPAAVTNLLPGTQAKGWTPAFDVVPAFLITGMITDRNIACAPYEETLEELVKHTPRKTIIHFD